MSAEWHSFGIDVANFARDCARKQADAIYARCRARRGRSRSKIEHSSYVGILAEMYHHRNDLRAWHARWLNAQQNGDDGGVDDSENRNVKAVEPGHKRVFVRDQRADTYVVYEVDIVNQRIRPLATFTRDQIQPDVWGGVPGVFISDIITK